MSQASLDLIDAMHDIAEECEPITGRGIGYKLFSVGLTPSTKTGPMQKVYRLLRIARERRGLQSSMDIGSGRLCGFKAQGPFFLFVANDAEHIIERSNALSGKDRFPLDFIDRAFSATAGFGEPLGTWHCI